MQLSLKALPFIPLTPPTNLAVAVACTHTPFLEAAEKAVVCTHNSSSCMYTKFVKLLEGCLYTHSRREGSCMYTQFVKSQRRQLHVHTSCQVADKAVACTHNLSSRREAVACTHNLSHHREGSCHLSLQMFV